MTRNLTQPSQETSLQRLAGKLPRSLAVGGLALILVTALLRPADSIEVERGAALFLVPLAVGTWLTSVFSLQHRQWLGSCRTERWFNGLLIAWLAWMLLATLSVWGEGNLRYAVNELWWWVSGVFVLVAARNSLASSHAIGLLRTLLLGMLVGVCSFAAHQQLVSLPSDRALYESDPELVLAKAGIDAPPGSPRRMLFEARLYSGGVTGTFALANSLAGFVVLCLPVLLGEILVCIRGRNYGLLILWLAAAVLALFVLVWTDSLSAYLSLFIGLALGILLHGFPTVTSEQRNVSAVGRIIDRHGRTLWVLMFTGAAAMACIVALTTSLWSYAPRSLAFRFQYWNATFKMVTERPWFGAGPGNYQQRYSMYRLDEASEGIADPHNWFMEILGASGFIGLLLCLAIALIVVFGLARKGDPHESVTRVDNLGPSEDKRFMAAIVVMAVIVGFMGTVGSWVASLSLPDFDALLLLFLTTAVVLGAGLRLEQSRGAILSDSIIAKQRKCWATAGLTTLGIHLLASGGLTVPGVAIPAIILAGYVIAGVEVFGQSRGSDQQHPELAGHRSRTSKQIRMASVVLAGSLLLAWQVSAWKPTNTAARWTREAGESVLAGYTERGLELYEMAAQADRWDPQPLIGASQTLVWLTIRSPSMQEVKGLRERLDSAISRAIEREPGAALWRELRGRQRLILYQRFGESTDLELARESLALAIDLSPGEVDWVAQLAAVEAARGNRNEAVRLIERAKELSAAGGHADRNLEVVRVLEVREIGESVVRSGPKLQSAANAFAGI